MARLTVVSGPEQGRVYPLGQSQVLGRLGKSSIRVADSSVSREHARLYLGPEGYQIVDLNSRNGTLVNGNQVHKYLLTPGDEIQIGTTRFRIEFDPEALTAEPQPAAPPESRAARDSATGTEAGIRLRGRSLSATGRREGKRRPRPGSPAFAWLRIDLAQTSAFHRLLAGLLVLGLSVGLAYLVFRLTS